tara:strand:+ start:275 stop:565 length:291 start_codon:yes stop_codon:yes gene_type:complete
MPYFNKGGMTKNSSSSKIKTKRQKIFEEERIRKLEMSLQAFYDELSKEYMIVEKNQIEENGEEVEKHEILDSLNELSKEKVREIISTYAAKKPIGF